MGLQDYSQRDWQEFLTQAEQRQKFREHLSQDYDTENEVSSIYFQGVDSIDQSYEKSIENDQDAFFENNGSRIELTYKCYQEAVSVEFLEKNYILRTSDYIDEILSQCKILVLTANPIEKAMFHYLIANQKESTKISRILHDDIVYYVFRWGKYWVAHVPQTETGAYKDLGSNTTIYKALRHFTPNVIFSLGVAFGIDCTKQELGDVIVSRRILPYSENKRDRERIKPDRNQDKKIDNWLHIRFICATGFLDQVTYGDILSGGSVMSSVTEKDRVCLGYTSADYIVGGEMEGSALFQYARTDGIPCAVIKGICDWGVAKNGLLKSYIDENRKDKLQAFAMEQAFLKCNSLVNDKTLFWDSKDSRLNELQRRYNTSKICLNISLSILLVLGALLALQDYLFQIRKEYTKLFGAIFVCLAIILAFIESKPMHKLRSRVRSRRLRNKIVKDYLEDC